MIGQAVCLRISTQAAKPSRSGSKTSRSGSLTYTLRFETNGGSVIASQSVTPNGKAVEPKDPTRDGYVFTGWFTDSILTTLYDFNHTVTGDFTLYAGWQPADGSKPTDYGHPAYILGYSDRTFRPNDTLTRAEFMVMALGSPEVQAAYDTGFLDVPKTHWAAAAIMTAIQNGYAAGYGDGTFGPERDVTRAEAVMILNRIIGCPGMTEGTSFSDVSENHWAYEAAPLTSAVSSCK